MNDLPSTTASNGRNASGKFGPGNRYAKGNPFAKRVARLRSALFSSVKPSDLREVIAALVGQAKKGDVASIKELLQRLLGPSEAVDTQERLELLEQRLQQMAESKEQSWRH